MNILNEFREREKKNNNAAVNNKKNKSSRGQERSDKSDLPGHLIYTTCLHMSNRTGAF